MMCYPAVFYRLFYYLEDEDLLNPVNDIHLFTLHYLPTTDQQNITRLVGVRTAGNRPPNQLFVEGALRLQNSGLIALDFSEHANADYGVVLQDDEGVEVPQTTLVFQEDHYEELHHHTNPEAQSDSYGIDFSYGIDLFSYNL